MFYTNGSPITKTFHGVTFKPGETKEVFGIINDPTFVPAFKEPPKCKKRTNSKSGEEKLLEPELEPVKKRRGRPRKADSAQTENSAADPDQSTDNSNKEV